MSMNVKSPSPPSQVCVIHVVREHSFFRRGGGGGLEESL